MKHGLLAVGVLVGALGMLSFKQETPRTTADAYSSLADAILAVKNTETNLVRSLLDAHRRDALAAREAGQHERAAAEMAVFANEGDNSIGGVRKRLLEGGHHHNADGEAKGIYEPGYVIVTRTAKEQMLAASSAMRSANTDAERTTAWQQFDTLATGLLKAK